MTNITISAQVFEDMADRIEELEAKLFTCATDLDIYMNAHAALEAKLRWVMEERDATFALMLGRAEAAEAKLAKAVGALERLNVGEGWAAQIARTTLAELTGGKDA